MRTLVVPLQAESVACPHRDFCVSSTAVQAVPEMPTRSEKPVSISACFHYCLLGRAGKELVQLSAESRLCMTRFWSSGKLKAVLEVGGGDGVLNVGSCSTEVHWFSTEASKILRLS